MRLLRVVVVVVVVVVTGWVLGKAERELRWRTLLSVAERKRCWVLGLRH